MASYMFFDITHESVTTSTPPPTRVCRRNPSARATIRTWAEDVAREFGHLSVTSATGSSTPEPLASQPTESPESSTDEVHVPRNESEVHVPRNGDTTQIHAPLATRNTSGHTKPAVNTQTPVAKTKASLLLPGMAWSPNASTGARIVSRLPTRKGPHSNASRTTPTHAWSPSPVGAGYRAPITNAATPSPNPSTPHSTHSSHTPPHSPLSSHTPPHSPPASYTRPLPEHEHEHEHEHEQHLAHRPLSTEHEYEQLLAEQRTAAAIREQEAQVARLRELARAAKERRLSEGAASCRRQEAAIADLWRKLGRTR